MFSLLFSSIATQKDSHEVSMPSSFSIDSISNTLTIMFHNDMDFWVINNVNELYLDLYVLGVSSMSSIIDQKF